MPGRRQGNGDLKSVNTAVGFGAWINRYADRNRNRAGGDIKVGICCSRGNKDCSRWPNETCVATYQPNSYTSGRRSRLQCYSTGKCGPTDDLLVTQFHSKEYREYPERILLPAGAVSGAQYTDYSVWRNRTGRNRTHKRICPASRDRNRTRRNFRLWYITRQCDERPACGRGLVEHYPRHCGVATVAVARLGYDREQIEPRRRRRYRCHRDRAPSGTGSSSVAMQSPHAPEIIARRKKIRRNHVIGSRDALKYKDEAREVRSGVDL